LVPPLHTVERGTGGEVKSECEVVMTEGLYSNIFFISEGPSVIERVIQKRSCQYPNGIGKKIINMQKFSKKPQDSNVRKQTSACGDMILSHSFKIFNSSLFSPITPGPQIIEHIVTYYGKLNSYKAGEKIIYFEGFGEEPQKEHVHQKPRCPY
jgi:hypothetical protein